MDSIRVSDTAVVAAVMVAPLVFLGFLAWCDSRKRPRCKRRRIRVTRFANPPPRPTPIGR